MSRVRTFFGYGWAMPVTSRRSAIAASALEMVKRASGYRVAVGPAHRAWERAVGVA